MEAGLVRGKIKLDLDLSDLRETVDRLAVALGKKGVHDLDKFGGLLSHLLGDPLQHLWRVHLRERDIQRRSGTNDRQGKEKKRGRKEPRSWSHRSRWPC